MVDFLKSYYKQYEDLLFDDSLFERLMAAKTLLVDSSRKGGTSFIQGNGASAAIAGHCALDFTKQAKIKTFSFNEASLITAYANDYGYEDWVAKALESYATQGDTAILISSSGTSKNIINAANYARSIGMNIITFSGFSSNNPLNQLGDLNFLVNSRSYNIIECIHMIWLTTIIDMIIGKSEYSVK
ncbi:D-sedoheptulose-7-phosphate isomerase [Sediminispirochaeta bajacaliforniensis]|uniref:D-sedoheptulose-7-phosphate isomerase n=1 Tax=Sediminispirochaeta bajacaliforniensis TaxID=148 RepID=UPI00035DC1E5|nr:SIS domain-containing protein [Sediminispirochaeta bajacaliforniensis]